jgi:cell wall-associated NlpC family hydrolase
MRVRENAEQQGRMAIKLPLVLFASLLFFAVGCAPKVVIQSPSSLPPRDATFDPSVSEILLSQFQAWKGVRHRVGGTDRHGVDCSGLVQVVFREAFQVDLPRTSREQSLAGRPVETRDLRPGDLVYFLDKRGDHIGVIVSDRTFMHASASQGVILSTLDGYWWPRLKRVQRVLS